MENPLAVAVLAGALGLAGCAATEPQASATANPQSSPAPNASKDGVYLTGSRLPRKTTGEQPVSAISQQEWQRSTTDAYIPPKAN